MIRSSSKYARPGNRIKILRQLHKLVIIIFPEIKYIVNLECDQQAIKIGIFGCFWLALCCSFLGNRKIAWSAFKFNFSINYEFEGGNHSLNTLSSDLLLVT